MPRHHSGSHRDPLLIKFDRHSEISALHEAKLAAWAFAIGEGAPDGPGGHRRMHRGLLSDLPAPEPPAYPQRPGVLKRLVDALVRLFSSARAPAAGAAAELVHSAVGESATITYIDRTTGAEAAAAEAGETQPIRSRAA